MTNNIYVLVLFIFIRSINFARTIYYALILVLAISVVLTQLKLFGFLSLLRIWVYGDIIFSEIIHTGGLLQSSLFSCLILPHLIGAGCRI